MRFEEQQLFLDIKMQSQIIKKALYDYYSTIAVQCAILYWMNFAKYFEDLFHFPIAKCMCENLILTPLFLEHEQARQRFFETDFKDQLSKYED